MLCAAVAFAMTHLAPLGGASSLGLLVGAAILLDFGVAGNMSLGQRAIFTLDAAARSRLNAVYMTTFFLGGAMGSALGGWAYAREGGRWPRRSAARCRRSRGSYFATERAPTGGAGPPEGR
jgi:MFS family permease